MNSAARARLHPKNARLFFRVGWNEMTRFPIDILWVHFKGIVFLLMLEQDNSLINATKCPFPYANIFKHILPQLHLRKVYSA